MIVGVAGEPPARLPPAHPAGAGGVPDDDDASTAHRHRGRGGLRLARGVHPRVQAGVRRRAGGLAREARAHPARGAERRPLPPTRRPPAARTRRGDLHGPARRGWSSTTSGSPARWSTVAERLTDEQLDEAIEVSVEGVDDDPTLRSLLSPARSARWACGTPRWRTRAYDWSVEEHESLGSMRERLDAAGPAYLAHVREVVDEQARSTTRSSTRCASPPRCSRTAG